MPLAEALDAAIEDCIAAGRLASYLEHKKAEVRMIFLDEYDAELLREQDRQEGFEIGLEQGLEQGQEQGLKKGLEQGQEQGLKQGLEQGLERGLEQAAERLRSAGFGEDAVRVALGLEAERREA